METFTPPTDLNGVQLRAELQTAGVEPAQQPRIDGDGRLVLDVPASARQTVQAVLDAHTPDPDFGQPDEDRQIRLVRAKAQEVAAGTGTFTAAQVQKILSHLILRSTR